MKSESIIVCFCMNMYNYHTYFTIFNFQENTSAEHLILFIFLAKYCIRTFIYNLSHFFKYIGNSYMLQSASEHTSHEGHIRIKI